MVERYKVEISVVPSYGGVPVGKQMVSVYCDCKAKTHKVVVPPRNATPFDPLCFRQSTPHIAKDRHVKTSYALYARCAAAAGKFLRLLLPVLHVVGSLDSFPCSLLKPIYISNYVLMFKV